MDAIAKAGAWLVAIVLAIFWLRRDAKADAKRDANGEILNRVEQAHEVEQDVDRLTPDERRERLRNGRK